MKHYLKTISLLTLMSSSFIASATENESNKPWQEFTASRLGYTLEDYIAIKQGLTEFTRQTWEEQEESDKQTWHKNAEQIRLNEEWIRQNAPSQTQYVQPQAQQAEILAQQEELNRLRREEEIHLNEEWIRQNIPSQTHYVQSQAQQAEILAQQEAQNRQRREEEIRLNEEWIRQHGYGPVQQPLDHAPQFLPNQAETVEKIEIDLNQMKLRKPWIETFAREQGIDLGTLLQNMAQMDEIEINNLKPLYEEYKRAWKIKNPNWVKPN